MSMRERLSLWWKWYEGWMAALFVAVTAFLLGSVITSQVDDASEARDMQHVTEAYTAALKAKDDLIARLAGTSAQAAEHAAQAARDAVRAADGNNGDRP